MKGKKGVRLFKVLRELNVARDTLVVYLEEHGYTLEDTGPNARLTQEMYDEVLAAFADEKEAAQRHEQRVRQLRLEEDEGEADMEVGGDGRATVAEVAPALDEEEEAEIEAAAEPEPTEPEPTVVDETTELEVAEVLEDGAPADLETAAETVVEEETEEEETVVEEPAPAEIDEPEVEVADDVAATPVEEADDQPDAEATIEVVTDEEALVVEAAEDVEDVTDEEVDGEAADDAVISAKRYTLSGPRILGKVDIGSLSDATGARKKRRRKKKKKDESDDMPDIGASEKTDASRAGRKKRKRKGPEVDQEQVEQAMQETLRSIEQGPSRVRQRRRRQRREEHAAQRQRVLEQAEAESQVLRTTEFITSSELASMLSVPVTEVIRVCLELGMMVSINQRLDADSISLIADEFGSEVEFVTEVGADDIYIEEDLAEDLKPRSPVVTVMGHVDHGKTSLLDYIRRANVVAGESGGITQHIGAYVVQLPDERTLTFLDTPGHEAFTAMRARGAQVTDVVIIVVAADDSVMPQTTEAINHSRAAGVPMVVAINKIDKEDSNTDRVMKGLADESVLVEQYGGKVQCSLVSAKTGEGIDDLLEKVMLEAEVLDLSANPDRNGLGTVIESRVDKGRGVVATVLVQNGTVEVGDAFVVGAHHGRVRAMLDERERRIQSAGPSKPALLLGFDGSPEVGDRFVVFDDEREAREIAQKRQQIQREQSLRQRKHITLDDIGRRLALGSLKDLNMIVKADVAGSVEALTDALLQLSSDEVQVSIIHQGVGAITESDVMLASASDAVILGFQVRPFPGVRKLAEREEIDIRTYSIIYDAIEDVRDALEGMLSPEVSEETTGTAEVREIFKVRKVGTIAGCYMLEGKIKRSDRIRLIRDGVVIYEGSLASLKRFKEDVREVVSGYECGMSIENYQDIKVGDHIEAFVRVETKRQLEV